MITRHRRRKQKESFRTDFLSQSYTRENRNTHTRAQRSLNLVDQVTSSNPREREREIQVLVDEYVHTPSTCTNTFKNQRACALTTRHGFGKTHEELDARRDEKKQQQATTILISVKTTTLFLIKKICELDEQVGFWKSSVCNFVYEKRLFFY